MSTRYEEMCEAALADAKERGLYRDRCWQALSKFVAGFVRYCQIPDNNLIFARWNGLTGDQKRYLEPDNGQYLLLGAASLEDDGRWSVGIRLGLGNRFVSFVVYVFEKDGISTIAIGPTEPVPFSTESDERNIAIYVELVEKIKKCFSGSAKPQPGKVFGFVSTDPANA